MGTAMKARMHSVVKRTPPGLIDFVLYNPLQLSESIAIFPPAIWKECNGLKDCLDSAGVSPVKVVAVYLLNCLQLSSGYFQFFLSLFAHL